MLVALPMLLIVVLYIAIPTAVGEDIDEELQVIEKKLSELERIVNSMKFSWERLELSKALMYLRIAVRMLKVFVMTGTQYCGSGIALHIVKAYEIAKNVEMKTRYRFVKRIAYEIEKVCKDLLKLLKASKFYTKAFGRVVWIVNKTTFILVSAGFRILWIQPFVRIAIYPPIPIVVPRPCIDVYIAKIPNHIRMPKLGSYVLVEGIIVGIDPETGFYIMNVTRVLPYPSPIEPLPPIPIPPPRPPAPPIPSPPPININKSLT